MSYSDYLLAAVVSFIAFFVPLLELPKVILAARSLGTGSGKIAAATLLSFYGILILALVVALPGYWVSTEPVSWIGFLSLLIITSWFWHRPIIEFTKKPPVWSLAASLTKLYWPLIFIWGALFFESPTSTVLVFLVFFVLQLTYVLLSNLIFCTQKMTMEPKWALNRMPLILSALLIALYIFIDTPLDNWPFR